MWGAVVGDLCFGDESIDGFQSAGAKRAGVLTPVACVHGDFSEDIMENRVLRVAIRLALPCDCGLSIWVARRRRLSARSRVLPMRSPRRGRLRRRRASERG